PLIHESDPSDGRFEIVVLRTRNAIELLPAVWAAIVDRMTGQHAGRSAGVETHVASSVRVQMEPPLPMQFDGEILPASASFEIEVLPRAARLLVPDESTASR
ncbi:MAG: diacylglycerol kinase, partial [Actinomycetota bacterium]|nr:diacylglycerol kinase [Actinomycetota bacterium]